MSTEEIIVAPQAQEQSPIEVDTVDTVDKVEHKIQIISNDGVTFNVDQSMAEMSETIRASLTGEESFIPLPNIDAATFIKVMAYLEHYSGKDDDFKDDDWDTTFLKMGHGDIIKKAREDGDDKTRRDHCLVMYNEVCGVILAANYLHIKRLLDVGCKKMAYWMRGRTPEEIFDFFGLAIEQFKPEEIENIRNETCWCEEKYERKPEDDE